MVANQLPTFITESPLHPILIGLLVGFGCGAAWLIRKRPLFLGLAAITVVVTAGMVVLEAVLVTDREQIHSELDQMAEAVRANDTERLLEHLSPHPPGLRQSAKSQMDRWEISFCRILSRRDPEIQWAHTPPQAQLRFVALASGHSRGGDGIGGTDRLGINLVLEKESDGRWRVVAYNLFNPSSGIEIGY